MRGVWKESIGLKCDSSQFPDGWMDGWIGNVVRGKGKMVWKRALHGKS